LVDAALVQAQRLPGAGNEARLGHRVAAREQGDLVALPDQLLGEIGDDPLRAAVELGRHALIERCDLRDPQCRTHLPRGLDLWRILGARDAETWPRRSHGPKTFILYSAGPRLSTHLKVWAQPFSNHAARARQKASQAPVLR